MNLARALLPPIVVLTGIVCAGCAEARSQEAEIRWEHGVFEWVSFLMDKGESERYLWATADTEVKGNSIGELWTVMGIKSASVGEMADRVRIIDHLRDRGWEFLSESADATSVPGGFAVAHRYLFHRQR